MSKGWSSNFISTLITVNCKYYMYVDLIWRSLLTIFIQSTNLTEIFFFTQPKILNHTLVRFILSKLSFCINNCSCWWSTSASLAASTWSISSLIIKMMKKLQEEARRYLVVMMIRSPWVECTIEWSQSWFSNIFQTNVILIADKKREAINITRNKKMKMIKIITQSYIVQLIIYMDHVSLNWFYFFVRNMLTLENAINTWLYCIHFG